jgi:hypothetical protein
VFINTVNRGVEEEEHKQSTTEHSGEQLPQLTTDLRNFHRQPLLFIFPSFSFSFVFCILHCQKKKNRSRAQ